METVEEFAARLKKMTYEEFFRTEDPTPERFDPHSDEWQDVHWGTTPLGGDVSIVSYYDKDGNRCKKADKAYSDITIYTKEGEYVNSVMGVNPYRNRRPS